MADEKDILETLEEFDKLPEDLKRKLYIKFASEDDDDDDEDEDDEEEEGGTPAHFINRLIKVLREYKLTEEQILNIILACCSE